MAWVETAIVYAVTAAAAAYLLRTTYRIFRPKRSAAAPGCARCAANPAAERPRT